MAKFDKAVTLPKHMLNISLLFMQKYQKAWVKALAQVDFLMYMHYLSTSKIPI